VLTYEALDGLEKKNIERALAQTEGKIAGPGGAAQLLGVKPSTLNSKLKAFGIRRAPR
jgi:transcriptional regulator with GAF, ATPase, and Fis domain